MRRAKIERYGALVSAGLALAIVVGAMFGARCSEAHYAALLERARTAESHGARCRAMNALCLRGYWDARPTAELLEFLRGAPPDVEAFVRDAHFTLLGKRGPGGPRPGGC